MESQQHILLTIDVEDWFQVENFKPWIPFSTWDQRELRVEKNVHRLLNLFDSIELRGQRTEERNPNSETGGAHSFHHRRIAYPAKSEDDLTGGSNHFHLENDLGKKKSQRSSKSCQKETSRNKIRATFFVLAWLAERLPNLVREIQSRGHEIASHGCNHELPELLSADELKQDLTESKKLLEDITGAEVAGYRAPSFAINDDILNIIEDAGYLYDSSYNSFGLHGRYGKVSLNGAGKKGISHKLSNDFYELPVSNLMVNKWCFPLGGGGYFRLVPYRLFRHGVKATLKKDDAYIFYMHPWEIDHDQPKVNQADFNFKIRHYTNLNKTQARLRRLIESFSHCQFVSCREYLNGIRINTDFTDI
jgi:polysaccharide deacetylase family protein (PEP-CTERM system associated)